MAYATVAQIGEYLGEQTATDDHILLDMITRAQQIIDIAVGFPFEASADALRYFTVGVDTDGRYLYFDTWLASITTVTTNADDGSGGTDLTSSEYVTLPRNDAPYYGLKILESSSNEWDYTSDAEAGIEITGRWAFSTTAPADIVHATLRLASYIYRQKDHQVFETIITPAGEIVLPSGTPQDVLEILSKYKPIAGTFGMM